MLTFCSDVSMAGSVCEPRWECMHVKHPNVDERCTPTFPFAVFLNERLERLLSDSCHQRSYGVMVSTLDFESSDPSSNLGRTCFYRFLCIFRLNQYKLSLFSVYLSFSMGSREYFTLLYTYQQFLKDDFSYGFNLRVAKMKLKVR